MRFRKMIKPTIKYTLALLAIWIFLSQCVIMKNRWSDGKAYGVFKTKHVPLQIYDTIINGHHLHYAVCGNDNQPTLVFIHGSPGSWMNYMKFMWDSAMRNKFRIVAIDRPGFGYSDFGKAMHLQDQCAIIWPVLEKLKNNQPMYLAGHSYGGPTAVKLAADHPGAFHTIIIISGALDINQEAKETWRHVMNARPMYWLLPGAFGPSNTELLYLKDDLVPLQNDFRNVTCHVLFVHGDADTWVPISNIGYGTKMMVNAASIHADTLHGADHQIPWKRKAELTSILLQL
ncbi:MAG: alpha/beta hydrolase [Bacteroidetes bacterium]|nr:alpha/beta hydrolase [Bacteroidota bacterium]